MSDMGSLQYIKYTRISTLLVVCISYDKYRRGGGVQYSVYTYLKIINANFECGFESIVALLATSYM